MRVSDIETKMRSALVLALLCAAAFLCRSESMLAQETEKLVAVPLPPMGWSSWNSFSNTVNSEVIASQARAMTSTGMKKAGYEYINIDEGWWLGERDANGNIVVDPNAWPALASGERAGDMSNIVRYIHGLGLKAGIYTDTGRNGCGSVGPDLGPAYPNEGSEGHYQQDFLQFAKWGFDYVKVDWCGGAKEKLDPAVQYAEIARAIENAEAVTHHRLYYSICDWGNNSPWTWAPGIGGVTADIWRVSGDIVAPIVANSKNSARKASFPGVLSNFDKGIHPESQHTGYYNDPDMMVLGMPGLTDEQNRVHMSLWAMSGAPLLVGADLTKLSDAMLAALTNPAVLAIDQDALGLQAAKVSEPGPGLEVWSKALSTPGERAVMLLNRGAEAALISVRWADLGLVGSASARLRDLWAQKDLGAFDHSYSTTVAAGDAVILLVHGSEGKLTTYEPEQRTSASSAASGYSLTFANIASKARIAPIRIAYSNPGKQVRIAELRVNGQGATSVAFPPTGGSPDGAIWIEAVLDRTGPTNVLTFSSTCDPEPLIESISLQ
jgi:hypothetical protein